MPIQPFRDLFTDWAENTLLSVKDLRLKAITLMAFVLMLRPSDIAPKAVHFNNQSGSADNFVFSTDNIVFCDNGEAIIVFHGCKNDSSRSGFQVVLQPTQDPKLNPVQALKDYIQRTAQSRPDGNPVFLTLSAPFRAISASTVATILNSAIKLAGLDGLGFSAKSFRPTGATAAIDANCDAEVAMKLGRWKTKSVFFDHYVHSKPPVDLTKAILELHP